jgi:putative chitinase
MQINEITEDISRRGFLGALGATAATGAQAMLKPQQPVAQSVPMQNPNVQKLMYWAKKYIKNPAELAAFMSQCAHESDNFHTLEEYGNTERFMRKYDITQNPAKAKELGNLEPGDGARFKGRGFMQITGRYNYREASKWVNNLLAQLNIPQRINFEQNPELVASPTAGALASLWYWETVSKHKVKNFNNTKQVSKTINPGLKGEKNREQKAKDWQVALNVKPNVPKVPHPGKPIRLAQK